MRYSAGSVKLTEEGELQVSRGRWGFGADITVQRTLVNNLLLTLPRSTEDDI